MLSIQIAAVDRRRRQRRCWVVACPNDSDGDGDGDGVDVDVDVGLGVGAGVAVIRSQPMCSVQ